MGIALLGVGAMVVRAGWLGIVDSGTLSAAAAAQQQQTLALPAQRGSITDRNASQMAFDRLSDTVIATPYQVIDPAQAASQLAPLLHMAQPDVLTKLTVSGGYSVVATGLSQAEGTAVRHLAINGISVQDGFTRVLPQGDVGAQALGLVGANGGISGIEAQYNPELTGIPGEVVQNADPQGQALSVAKNVMPVAGANVQLTLDENIQANLEAILASTKAQFGAKAVSGVVMQPQTGAILGMATSPGYDPNNRRTFDPARARVRTVTDTFEPGSIFKIVTMAGAIQEGLVTPNTKFVVPPVLHVYDLKLHDAESHGTAVWPVSQILERSSNIGTVEVAQRLGARSLTNWIKAFGFGQLTGVDLPGESTGFFPEFGSPQWSGVSIANLPIGQGVSVTQIQIARAYAAIANGGVMITPHFVESIGGHPVVYPPGQRVISTATAHALNSMLKKVVSVNGTGDAATVKGYTVAGKTGTAQVIGANGKYSNSLFMSSFAGYVPANHPQMVIVVTVDEPATGTFGGTVAAPAFSQIASMALVHLGIAPG